MKTCLIYQPLGLGDVFWLQPIIDRLLNSGYKIYYPVGDVYYDMVSSYIEKPNLHWKRETDDYPLKQHYGSDKIHQTENELYIPFGFADRYFFNAPIMATKYYFVQTPMTDWRKHVEIKRNKDREQRLIDKYQLHGDYVLVNKNFGTNPKTREINIQSDKKIHVISYQDSTRDGFYLFDWIGAVENASEIHTVETSFCYLVDKYAKTNNLNMYEKRTVNQQNDYYRNVGLVYKNSNWMYHA